MGMLASYTCFVQYIKKGLRGIRGAMPRGPQEWESLEAGYTLYCGDDSEEVTDIVYYKTNKQYYTCIKTHAKSSSILPTNTSYFRLSQTWELIVAKAVLADAVIMMDSSGKVIFRAEGGVVECETGIFENVQVSGDIKASTLDLAVGASCYLNETSVVLPALSQGVTREVTILNIRTRSTDQRTTTVTAGTGAVISKTTSIYDTNGVTNSMSLDYGLYRAYGFNNEGGTTYWFIEEITVKSS